MKKIKLLYCWLAVFNSISFFSVGQVFNEVKIIKDHDGGITVLTTDPSKSKLIAGDEKGKLYFYDLATGSLIQKINAHSAPVSQLKFNSNGSLLISSTSDGEIKIFDFNKNTIIQAIYSPDYSGINFVLFSIADGFIYFNGNNKLFKTRSDLTQNVVQIFNESDTLNDAVITSDRSALIFAEGNKLMVLNTRTDQLRQEIKFGTSKIEKIALVKDSILSTWSADGTFAMWSYRLNQLSPQPIFYMKAGNPSPMAFSESGKYMCSGNIGNWARVWIPLEKKIEQELFLHKDVVTCAAFGTSDESLFTGSMDKTIIQWKKGTELLPEIKKPASKPEQISTPKPVIANAEVSMSNENIPTIIKGRNVISTETIEINQSSVKIYVFDNNYIDGDTMSLFFNGKWIVDHYGVTKKKHEISLDLIENTNNVLVLFANNLGKSPPNTAAIEFDIGNKKYFYKLSSDLKSCSAINFVYKK